MTAAAILAGLAPLRAMAGAVFAAPTALCQTFAAQLGSPVGVIVSGVVGLLVLGSSAWRGWAGCDADPVWVTPPGFVEDGYLDHPCDGPAGLLAHAFLMLGAPLTAPVMGGTTVVPWRRARRCRAF